jgi:diketogulonate reductase-like aldo/keto reductase
MWWAYIRGGLYSGGLIVGGLRYIDTSGNWENEKLYGNTISHNFEFSQFSRVLI